MNLRQLKLFAEKQNLIISIIQGESNPDSLVDVLLSIDNDIMIGTTPIIITQSNHIIDVEYVDRPDRCLEWSNNGRLFFMEKSDIKNGYIEVVNPANQVMVLADGMQLGCPEDLELSDIFPDINSKFNLGRLDEWESNLPDD
jgi:hypothetical protein